MKQNGVTLQGVVRVAIVAAVLALASSAQAQTAPMRVQSSTALEGSHVFSGSKMMSLTVVWHSAANRWLQIFDATTAPANGAVTPMYCAPISLATDPADGFKSFDWAIHPIWATTGVTAVVSTSATGCFAKTVDGANDAFYAQVTD